MRNEYEPTERGGTHREQQSKVVPISTKKLDLPAQPISHHFLAPYE
jgi:hypothetical protein